MGISIYLIWVRVNQEESMLGVSSEFTEGSNCGLISAIKSRTPVQNGRSHSLKHLTQVVFVEKVAVEAKQPNSAVRKCVRVQLKKNNKRITAYVPRDGGMSFIDENDDVLVAGFGRAGHAKGDFQVLDLRSSRLPVAVSMHFGLTKRKSQWHEE